MRNKDTHNEITDHDMTLIFHHNMKVTDAFVCFSDCFEDSKFNEEKICHVWELKTAQACLQLSNVNTLKNTLLEGVSSNAYMNY